jgi:WD40 repeat protein
VRLWLVPNLQSYADLTPPTPPVTANSVPPTVNAIAFGPGGRTLVSASNDGTAQVWDLDPADEVSALCDALREPGFAAEWQQLSPSPGPDPCGAG